MPLCPPAPPLWHAELPAVLQLFSNSQFWPHLHSSGTDMSHSHWWLPWACTGTSLTCFTALLLLYTCPPATDGSHWPAQGPVWPAVLLYCWCTPVPQPLMAGLGLNKDQSDLLYCSTAAVHLSHSLWWHPWALTGTSLTCCTALLLLYTCPPASDGSPGPVQGPVWPACLWLWHWHSPPLGRLKVNIVTR